MAEIHLDINVDAEKVINNLKYKERNLDAFMFNFMNKLAFMGQQMVKSEAPIKTGRLRSAVQKTVSGKTAIIFVAGGIAPYFRCVLDGTRPHLITPKNKKMLYWPGARHPVREVWHPGTKANPFVDRSAVKLQKAAEAQLRVLVKWLEA